MTLNSMFPDADTSAHDERMRLEREGLDQEWWRELEGMTRSSPADADADSNTVDDDGSEEP